MRRDPVCSACGVKESEDEGLRVRYDTNSGLVLCQRPAYRRGESSDPGCLDKVADATQAWAESQGQQRLQNFL